MNLSQFSTLQKLEIAKCPKLISLPPLPWTSSTCHVLIKEAGSHFRLLDYQRNNQSKQGLQIEGKDGPLDSTSWKLLAFSNLTEPRELKMKKCPPLPLEHLKLLSALRRLSITDSGIALLSADGDNTITYHFPVEQLKIYECSASGKEMTQLLSYFPKLMNMRIENCQKIIETWCGRARDDDLAIDCVRGMETLAQNLSSLTRLSIWDFEDLRGKSMCSLLAQGHLRVLAVHKTPKFSVGSKPSGLQQLYTDDITGVLVEPTCSFLSSSLTRLSFNMDHKVERFTKEQNMALQLLSSLEVLIFVDCPKLRSLPAGLHRLTSLNRLEIASCPNIRSLPTDGFPSSLEVLHVYESKSEELKRQCRKLKGTIPIVQDEDYLEL
uniref:NB-ARC domain-containing protein n=1 Tax=Oryza punctata TaxID=4537 RepID=A0A0E0LD54_ORYPU